MSAREQCEAEARRIIAIIDGSNPGARDRYRDLRHEAGTSAISSAKLLLNGFTDAAIEQAAAASLLADTAYAAAREIRHAADGAVQTSLPMSTAPFTSLPRDVPRLAR